MEWIPTPRKSSPATFYKQVAQNIKPSKTTPKPSINIIEPEVPETTTTAQPKPTSTINHAPTPAELHATLQQTLKDKDFFPKGLSVQDDIGKLMLMQPRTHSIHHPAAPLLQQYCDKGCPVDCGPDWSSDQIIQMLQRGPHRSATSNQAINQLISETEEKITQGYARVVKWQDIKNNIPPKLKLSPIAMIPHKSKAFRCILDLSFALSYKGQRYPSVNEATTKLAQQQSMVQLGKSLQRIITIMAIERQNDNNLPFLFSKLDIKDGFWRMAVSNLLMLSR